MLQIALFHVLHGRWLINGSYTHSYGSELNQQFVDKGFSFPSPVHDGTHGNIHTIIMIISASLVVDNTIITCEFGAGVVSENAILQVISGESEKYMYSRSMNVQTIAY